jgi:HAD superfamily hydrolase (TIGR01549 family)
MSVRFIIFDAFGALLKISEGRHPHRQILKEGIRQGRSPQINDLRQIMTQNLSLHETAENFGIEILPDGMTEIQGALEEDLSRIAPFEDGLYAVNMLRNAGVKLAIVSNLAAPYADPVKRHFPGMDAYGLSFAIGAMKPEPFMYRATCELLGARTDDYFNGDRVIMIGDSQKCDRDGPRRVGIRGFLLNRNGGKDFRNLKAIAELVLADNALSALGHQR